MGRRLKSFVFSFKTNADEIVRRNVKKGNGSIQSQRRCHCLLAKTLIAKLKHMLSVAKTLIAKLKHMLSV